jgi:5,10-methenyltetrahydrofolate synthetase
MNDESLDVTAWRALTRADLLARRTAIPLAERRRLDERVNDLLRFAFAPQPGWVVGFYWPMKAEVDPRVAVDRFREMGARAALPVVVKRHAALQFREWWPGIETQPGVFGLPIPQGSAELVPDVVLVPPVGFDEAGYRLGYGGGYFDRTLARLSPQPLKIGLARESGRIDTIHPQGHDIPMDFIVTERGIHEVTGRDLRLVEEISEASLLARRLVERRRAMPVEELGALLNTLLEAERAGALVTSAFVDELRLPMRARASLAGIQRDESGNCAVLRRLLRSLGLEPSRSVGEFFGKAIAIREPRARLEFLNRGQAWVARRIAEALPRIADPEARLILKEMHESHLANIALCDELLAGQSEHR